MSTNESRTRTRSSYSSLPLTGEFSILVSDENGSVNQCDLSNSLSSPSYNSSNQSAISIHSSAATPLSTSIDSPLMRALDDSSSAEFRLLFHSTIKKQITRNQSYSNISSSNNNENSNTLTENFNELELMLDEICMRLFPFDKQNNSYRSLIPPVTVIPFSLTPTDSISVISRALIRYRAGEFLVVCDSVDRENESDLIIAAELVSPAKLSFMVNETSGIICVGVTELRCEELSLPPMVIKNTDSHQTAFTVSVDYRHGTTTGISAFDRSATIKAIADQNSQPTDFTRPGHIFPLQSKAGGVLERSGHTESSVDLSRLAGLQPCGALSEIVKRDGSMARPGEIRNWANRKGIMIISVEQLIEYRKATEK